MATDFTQDSLLRFIVNNGGKVRNADLLLHYKRFLKEDEDREQNRELFKRYVNTVAAVRQEEGVNHVVLKKKYRVHLGDIAKKLEPERQKERDSKPQAEFTIPTRVEVLPAAGIVTFTNNNNNNNDSTPTFQKSVKTSSAHWREQPAVYSSSAEQVNNTCRLKPKPIPSDTDSRSSGSGQSFEQPQESKATRELEQSIVYPAKQRQLREADGCEQSFGVAPAYYEVGVSPLVERKSLDALETFDVHAKLPGKPGAQAWPLRSTLGRSHVYNSSPCLLDRPVSPHIHSQAYTHASLSQSNESLLRPNGGYNGFPIQEQDEYEFQMYGMPEDGSSVHASATYLQPLSLSSSRDSFSPCCTPPDIGWRQEFGREEQSSGPGLEGGEEDRNDVRAFLRRSQEARLLSQLHQPSRNITSLHHSTGHLDDENSSTRSSSPETHNGPIARRLTSRMRSRLCRSLGEDLDHTFSEDNVSARHNRLRLLSSNLSMGNLVAASSSRGHNSLSSPTGSTQSLGTSVHDGSFSSKHSTVPLDSKEHDWFVKAASGSWTDIYALLREDPNLLNKRDFISGFTVLHWVAKHGDHRVLNTLSYGVEKVGTTLDVNAKTLCGYTPLHLAAIHGHKKLIRLLVQKFKADVRLRDSSGKRPWQYLSKDEQRDILELLGAPQKRLNCCPATLVNLVTRSATTKINVKRNTSIAALFKHKSHLMLKSSPEAF